MRSSRLLLRALVCAALAVPALAAPQWQKQSPIPGEWHVQARIDFLDAARGYMVGYQPTPLETLDGGVTWHAAPVPGDDYEAVFALDAQHAWLAGSGGTVRTTDGGQTWLSLPWVGTMRDMEFLSPSFGWANTNGPTGVTHDGGLTWTFALPSTGVSIGGSDFRDTQVGIGVEDDNSSIWRTTDGGSTWQPVYSATVDTVRFLSSTTALAIGFQWPDYFAHRSTDGGATWQPIPTAVAGARVVSVGPQHALLYDGLDWSLTTDGGQTFVHGAWNTGANVTRVVQRGPQELFALDTNGNVLMSSDAGATWTQTRQGTYVGLSDLAFLGNGRAVAVGIAYVLTSDTNGATWVEVSSGTNNNLYDIAMWDGQRGLFCGANATTCTTNNAGGHWTNGRPAWEFAGMNDAEAISTVGSDFAIVVGEAGAPIVTHDGGQSWTQLASFQSSHALGSVDFVTEQVGWVGSVGPTAWLLRTTDGGQSFELQYGPTFGSIRSIDMLDTNVGYAIAGGSLLLKTTNGGQNWAQSTLPIPQGAIDLAFSDAQTGWLVGDFGTILRTTNGAASWQAQDAGVSSHLADVEVVSATEAWAVGSSNTVLHTVDAGVTWESISVPTGDPFHNWEAVTVAADGGVYLAGWNGVVMHLDPPSQGTAFCGWDDPGSTGCPCGNNPPESGTGCLHSLGGGASIAAHGSASVADDALSFRLSNAIPNQPGMLIQGASSISLPFKDGILCAGNPTERLAVVLIDGTGAGSTNGASIVTAGAVSPGDTRYYQFWYRDPGGVSPCGTGSNLSNALELLWN